MHTMVRWHEDCCVVTAVDVHMFFKQKSCCRHFRSKISHLKDYNWRYKDVSSFNEFLYIMLPSPTLSRHVSPFSEQISGVIVQWLWKQNHVCTLSFVMQHSLQQRIYLGLLLILLFIKLHVRVTRQLKNRPIYTESEPLHVTRVQEVSR